MKTIIAILIVFFTGCSVERPIDVDCSGVVNGQLNGFIHHNLDKCDFDYSRTLELNSNGGYTNTAIRIADNVALHGTDTVVYERCTSACVLIATAAEHRSMCKETAFYLHTGSTEETTVKYLEYIKKDGRMNYTEIERIVRNTPFESSTLVFAERAKELGMIDQVLYCN